MAEVLKKFGRYFLLDQLAQGGMAEIYRARLSLAGGARRILVIKKVQASFGANTDFIQMFQSETNVMMGFNHPNIIQLYDFGEEHSQPFIAMEFVDGKNLRQIISRTNERKQSFPIELSAHIVEHVACGLFYAHSFKDKLTGEHLAVIHRDISPQNILISYEGAVKLIDFGIAKTTINVDTTKAGVIKGKPSYLSPEQISGDVLDARSDIFALGIVLWELLVGKKLFVGESDLAILKLIESCQNHVKPPSSLNPAVPPDLDFIVLKALSKQPEKRYQTGEEMQFALHKFLYSYMPEFNPASLSYYTKDLFKDVIIEDRKRMQLLNEKVEKLLAIPQTSAEANQDKKNNSAEYNSSSEIEINQDNNSDKKNSEADNAHTKMSAAKPGAQQFIFDTPNIQGGSNLEMEVRIPTKNPTYFPQNTKRFSRNGQKAGGSIIGGFFKLAFASLLVGGIYFGAQFGAKNDMLKSLVIKYWPDPRRNLGTVTPTSAPAQASRSGTIALRLNLQPDGGGARVYLNGTAWADLRRPMEGVALNTPITIIVEKPGYKIVRRETSISSAQTSGLSEWVETINLEPVRFGFVTIHTSVTALAEFRAYDGSMSITQPSPFNNIKLPVGNYTAVLKNETLGMEKVLQVKVEEGKIMEYTAQLEISH